MAEQSKDGSHVDLEVDSVAVDIPRPFHRDRSALVDTVALEDQASVEVSVVVSRAAEVVAVSEVASRIVGATEVEGEVLDTKVPDLDPEEVIVDIAAPMVTVHLRMLQLVPEAEAHKEMDTVEDTAAPTGMALDLVGMTPVAVAVPMMTDLVDIVVVTGVVIVVVIAAVIAMETVVHEVEVEVTWSR